MKNIYVVKDDCYHSEKDIFGYFEDVNTMEHYKRIHPESVIQEIECLDKSVNYKEKHYIDNVKILQEELGIRTNRNILGKISSFHKWIKQHGYYPFCWRNEGEEHMWDIKVLDEIWYAKMDHGLCPILLLGKKQGEIELLQDLLMISDYEYAINALIRYLFEQKNGSSTFEKKKIGTRELWKEYDAIFILVLTPECREQLDKIYEIKDKTFILKRWRAVGVAVQYELNEKFLVFTHNENFLQRLKNFVQKNGYIEGTKESCIRTYLRPESRNEDRIEAVLRRLEVVWKKYPDMRFGELVEGLYGYGDIFTISDEILLEKLSEWKN